jgi:hypothetical protein
VQHSGQGGLGVTAAAQSNAERAQATADEILAATLSVEALDD